MTQKSFLAIGVFLAVVSSISLGFMVGYWWKDEGHGISLSKEILDMSLVTNFDPRITNPNDAAMWAAFLPEAKLCDNCGALREYKDGINYSRPLIIKVSGDEVGNTSRVGYVMVAGVVSESHEVGRRIAPRIIYYIAHASGSLARIDESGRAESRLHHGEWEPLENGSELLAQARGAFQQKWQHRLAAVRK